MLCTVNLNYRGEKRKKVPRSCQMKHAQDSPIEKKESIIIKIKPLFLIIYADQKNFKLKILEN